MQNRHFPAALIIVLFLIQGAMVHSSPAADDNRQRVLLDADWHFQVIADPPPADDLDCARPDFDDAHWRVLHLPHDYVLEGTFTPAASPDHGSLVAGAAWYRKKFELPDSAKGKAIWIDFDGVYRNSDVFLNGIKLGHHASGYTSFRYDISQSARFGGTNVLAVRTDASQAEGWWYEGGGIYRHVWLNIASPVHVAPWGVFVSSELPEPGADGVATSAKVRVNINLVRPEEKVYAGGIGLVNVAYPAPVISSQIIDPEGAPAGPPETTPAAGSTSEQEIALDHPRLWSLENPQMYRLHTEIRLGEQVVDAVDTPFGIRTIRFDKDQGFFLNGRAVKLKGTCNHQDFAGVGIAMPDSVLFWRIKTLKEMGSNAYRCSHNPPAAELLDACDRLGMLVMDENRHLGDVPDHHKSNPSTTVDDVSEIESMVLRDRNHPSIIMWSVCNEEPLGGTPHGAHLFSVLKAAVERADPTRPVTAAMNSGYDKAGGFNAVQDLTGINYNPAAYDQVHAAFPDKPLFASETASEVATRGIYDLAAFRMGKMDYRGDQQKGYVCAYDLNAPPWAQTAENAWKPIAERPFIAGGFVWTGFDYKGEPTPFGWPCISSHFGILDSCGFPKDSYYYYQAVWGDKPVVHVFPHWNWPGREGQPIDVWVYSNAERVELFLNGQSLGAKDMPRYGHLAWVVPYAPGRLEAKAFTGGRLIATDQVETTGAPAAVRLTTDRAELATDGEDVTMVSVDMVDAQGRIVPTADNEITFSIRGPAHLAGTGNGDPSSHEPDQATRRHAFNGRCLVLVGADATPGSIVLTAAATGLQPGTLNLTASPR